jgi:hypothetical protein
MSDSVQSRSEGILRDTIDGTSEYPHKKGMSRLEDLLIELLEEGGGGGGGDSTIYATSLSLTINPSTFVMTAQLLNKNGDPLGTAQTIDLPLESVVVNGAYDSQTKKVVLTLQNGNTIEFSVADLVSGLQTEITSQNKLSADLVDDTNSTNKFVTSAEKTTISKAVTTDNIGLGTDYFVYNGTRVYVGATEPTGTIPDDSIWLDPNDGANLFNPTNHNGIYRGKDLTNVYTISQMYDMIHDGSFKDLYLGDYFTNSITTDIYTHFTGSTFDSGTVYYEMSGTINDRTWTETEDATPQSGKTYATKLTKTENVTLMFAAFDYYYQIGDTLLSTHHAILIPRGAGFSTTAKMNSTNTTTGGYLKSDMHQITLPCYAKSLKIALGNHLLSYRALLSNAINASTPSMAGAGFTGASSGYEWTATELQLMTEQQVYGTRAWTSSGYDIGIDYRKLPVFNFVNPVQLGRYTFWLRTVASSTNFAVCNGNGTADYYGASTAFYVRPLILFG